MIRCEKCDQPCDVETVYWEESHGFSQGPREQWSAEVSDCCHVEVYEDGKDEPDAPNDHATAFADALFEYGVRLAKEQATNGK